ncbi:hypothetical protein HGRIS_013427 [Hohenbuehelia grisea]|uniref:Heterokaryon incompatibility domain-containing protein n=1 Tax=Hohenbuehelia grisea TaxID=104357 RepID=A0ABR3IVN1_9AGAR
MSHVIELVYGTMAHEARAKLPHGLGHAEVLASAQDLTKYAILSHRWDMDEVVYSDLKRQQNSARLRPKGGTMKFRKFCERAREYNCRYVWIDTACINRESSAEIDESIRSMFYWYRNAEVCFVYFTEAFGEDLLLHDPWFTRGWTLQELLAPRRVVFLDRTWSKIMPGTYDIERTASRETSASAVDFDDGDADFDESYGGAESPSPSDLGIAETSVEFLRKIAGLSGIEFAHLLRYTPGPGHARKVFTWISKRQTTRSEDMAYCLVGLLDLQLAPAYGEGLDRAFYRLQVECAQRTDDRSMFLWTGSRSPWNSMFPSHPSAFGNISQVTFHPDDVLTADSLFGAADAWTVYDPSLNFTNCGLRMMVSLHDVLVAETDWPPTPLDGETGDSAQRYRISFDNLPAAVVLKWKGEFPDRSTIEMKWKIGVIGSIKRRKPSGSHDELPVAVLLRVDRMRWPPRYRRFTSAEFESLPPMPNLTGRPPQTIFIE